MRALLQGFVGLCLVGLHVASLAAQPRQPDLPQVVLVVNDPDLERAARRGLHGRHVAASPEFVCDPHEATCASTYLRNRVMTQLVFVSVHLERAGCRPIRDPSGREVGHRMLQRRMLTVAFFGHDGVLNREASTEVPFGGALGPEVTEAVAALFSP